MKKKSYVAKVLTDSANRQFKRVINAKDKQEYEDALAKVADHNAEAAMYLEIAAEQHYYVTAMAYSLAIIELNVKEIKARIGEENWLSKNHFWDSLNIFNNKED